MSTITPAERGWHTITIVRTSKSTLAIFKVQKVTHWCSGRGFRFPLENGRRASYDPDDLRWTASASYLLDPQGRLLGHEGEVIANSVLELQEAYARNMKEAEARRDQLREQTAGVVNHEALEEWAREMAGQMADELVQEVNRQFMRQVAQSAPMTWRFTEDEQRQLQRAHRFTASLRRGPL